MLFLVFHYDYNYYNHLKFVKLIIIIKSNYQSLSSITHPPKFSCFIISKKCFLNSSHFQKNFFFGDPQNIPVTLELCCSDFNFKQKNLLLKSEKLIILTKKTTL